MALFKKERTFWVIFDTSQYPAYYRDVHDLIAAPKGYVLRYQYRDALLAESAWEHVQANRELPILFLYAQKSSEYRREETKSLPSNDNAPTLFILTRVGRMRHMVREGGKVYFDFEVESYPDNNKATAINELMSPLVSSSEVPWTKWVTVSNNYELFQQLCAGSDEDNWRCLVELLGKSPIQFANDAFWRIKGPFLKNGKVVSAAARKVKVNGEVRRITSEYRWKENSLGFLQLVSSAPTQVSPHRPQYAVEAKVSGSEKLKIVGSGTYALRHYDEKPIEYTTLEMSPFRTDSADLILQTVPTSESWTAGPRLEMRHVIRKGHMISLLGIASGLAGLGLTTLGGSKLFENDALNGVKILLIGLLLLTGAKYMLTGKLEFGK